METIKKLKPKMIIEIETRHHPTFTLNELIKPISGIGYKC
jgi:ABC-type Fe3+-citrate transport system substrate-binding protein